jgi:cell wall-associated NlpC family hydrolase
MKNSPKKLLTTLTLLSTILFLTTGCAPKNADGSYASTYSYHSYLDHTKNPNKTRNTTRRNYAQRVVSNNIYQPTNGIPNAITSKIENTAKSLLGTDYEYGANGPYQYDCSSFTKYVFAKQGISIPRVSRDQALRGQYIKARQLQKGDLVFFDSKKSTKVSHVGIYLGKGDFIHASSAQDKVSISNLNSNYYSKHFKWGRRVTNVNYAMR